MVQSFLREASRTVQIAVFKCEIVRKEIDQHQTIYFTNRVEIGAQQQQKCLETLHSYLVDGSIETRANLGAIKDNNICRHLKEAFACSFVLTEMDVLGKTLDLSQHPEQVKSENTAYIKLVNVPSPFDISGMKADPTDGSLCFSMLDSTSYEVFQMFLSKKHAL
jgi:hypothetical protein